MVCPFGFLSSEIVNVLVEEVDDFLDFGSVDFFGVRGDLSESQGHLHFRVGAAFEYVFRLLQSVFPFLHLHQGQVPFQQGVNSFNAFFHNLNAFVSVTLSFQILSVFLFSLFVQSSIVFFSLVNRFF